MATLEARLNDLATAIGTDIKDIYTKQGDLGTLDTTANINLVDAINEVFAGLGGSTDAVLYTTQSLTAPQQLVARQNIDAYGAVELGDPNTDLEAIYVAAKT